MLRGLADSAVAFPRPPLGPSADTNDANLYYVRGAWLLSYTRWLDTAEMAFYWANRLNPTLAEPIYARALLILAAVHNDMFATFLRTGSRGATRHWELSAREEHLIDSLQRVAYARNPFLYDGDLPVGLITVRGPLRELVARARWAHHQRNFQAAESLYARALRQHPAFPEDVGLRINHAQALFYLHRYDSTVAELRAARDSVRGKAEARLLPVVPPVEMFDLAIGIARVQQDDFPAARRAFEQALTDNLAFYWAHVRLAGADLSLGDTAAAVGEISAAVELEGHDPALRLFYGYALQLAGRLADAERELRAAIALDSDYATPHYRLGLLYRAQGRSAEAKAEFHAFLARCSRHDPDRGSAEDQLNALSPARPDSR